MSRLISMKVKTVLAGTVAIAAMGFAGSAFAQNDGSTGDGDLFLMVYDSTTGLTYTEDLGVTTGAVASDAAVAAAVSTTTGGNLSTALPGFSKSFAPDSSLSSYLSAHSGDSYQWAVMAPTSPINGTNSLLLTTAGLPTAISPTFNSSNGGGFSNGNIASNAGNLTGAIDSFTADLAANGVNANSLATAGFIGSDQYLLGQALGQGLLTWYGSGDLIPVVNWKPSAGSSSSNFYLATTASLTNNQGGNADIFNLGTVTLAANGALTFAANSVPLPAAVWLLGSGLLGLAGVARRRAASNVQFA